LFGASLSVKVALMIIKNSAEIGSTPLRRNAVEILESGIAAVLPANVLTKAVNYFAGHHMLAVNGRFYNPGSRIFVIGGGKAGGRMAEVIETMLPESMLIAGLVIDKSSNFNTNKIKVYSAGHPIPDSRGEQAVKEMLALKEKHRIGENDTVICLLSGGGSALMPYPAEGITLDDKKAVTDALLSCGAEIVEINTVRKHLSRIKGGWLGRWFAPARIITLIISDVIGNDLSTIASGPTYPDATTFKDALAVIDRYGLAEKLPVKVMALLRSGAEGKILETPKHLDNCDNYIIADNKPALEEMKRKACELGFNPLVITAEQKGETSVIAVKRALEIANGNYYGYDALIIGGETTPKLPQNCGTGGRNQHYVAASLSVLKKLSGEWVIASVGTDGCDFMPGIAGAIADNNTLQSIRNGFSDIESYICRYDSNTLLKSTGNSLIITGDTGTNVGDIMLYLLKKQV
jgi:glycerate-2-kinase